MRIRRWRGNCRTFVGLLRTTQYYTVSASHVTGPREAQRRKMQTHILHFGSQLNASTIIKHREATSGCKGIRASPGELRNQLSKGAGDSKVRFYATSQSERKDCRAAPCWRMELTLPAPSIVLEGYVSCSSRFNVAKLCSYKNRKKTDVNTPSVVSEDGISVITADDHNDSCSYYPPQHFHNHYYCRSSTPLLRNHGSFCSRTAA